MAVAGLLLGTLLWLVPFIIVGGEWFLMWQSQVWNVSNSAFRFFTISLLILIYFIQPDTEAEQTTDEKSEL
jgi:predicted small integral membrane protein